MFMGKLCVCVCVLGGGGGKGGEGGKPPDLISVSVYC